MNDVEIRKAGRAGRITLNRPAVMNALTWEMCLAIEDALDVWAGDDGVDLVIIDALGERAFCAGGDITELYRACVAGDFGYGRRFWADEYRLNARIAEYPKPFVAFMQGFTMGGGVGVSCHGSHRIVGDTSKIAMPETGIGLVPDIGGSLLLASAPGRIGEYMGSTGYRMGPGDAILAGFADHYLPEDGWPELIARLEATGDAALVSRAAHPAPPAPLAALRAQIDAAFAQPTLRAVVEALETDAGAFASDTLKTLGAKSPLANACAFELIGRVRGADDIRVALDMEYRFTWRAAEAGDLIEGIRAAVIDRDRSPRWKHGSVAEVPPAEIAAMLAPLPPTEPRLSRHGD